MLLELQRHFVILMLFDGLLSSVFVALILMFEDIAGCLSWRFGLSTTQGYFFTALLTAGSLYLLTAVRMNIFRVVLAEGMVRGMRLFGEILAEMEDNGEQEEEQSEQ